MLTADIMFINGLHFMIRGIMGEYMPSHTATYMGNALIKVMHFYSRDGFVVSVVLMAYNVFV
ncbi:hypothetical protein ACHAW6_004097 [Cyclotella cf. meneghiniana]